jgi:hypothetical protein
VPGPVINEPPFIFGDARIPCAGGYSGAREQRCGPSNSSVALVILFRRQVVWCERRDGVDLDEGREGALVEKLERCT